MRDYIGYLASVLVLCTFCARTMIPLRIIALASNVAFLAYGGLLHLYPVLLLHTVLMPVNVWRLAEIFRLRGHVRKGSGGDAVFTALLPFASRLTVPQGEVVIRKGEQSDCLYLVFEGALWVADAQVELGPGSVVGDTSSPSNPGKVILGSRMALAASRSMTSRNNALPSLISSRQMEIA